MTSIIKTTAQAPFAKRAAALKKHQPPRGDQMPLHAARAPLPERLLSKVEVLTVTGATFPTIWAWMRAGTFPRGRIVGGKSKWLASEVDAWLAGLPVRPLKGDAAGPEARAMATSTRKARAGDTGSPRNLPTGKRGGSSSTNNCHKKQAKGGTGLFGTSIEPVARERCECINDRSKAVSP